MWFKMYVEEIFRILILQMEEGKNNRKKSKFSLLHLNW